MKLGLLCDQTASLHVGHRSISRVECVYSYNAVGNMYGCLCLLCCCYCSGI